MQMFGFGDSNLASGCTSPSTRGHISALFLADQCLLVPWIGCDSWLRYYPFPLLFGAAKASELTLEGLDVGAGGSGAALRAWLARRSGAGGANSGLVHENVLFIEISLRMMSLVAV
jgi:hypothetical protein